MKGLQVSGTFSEEWCGHLAWRDNTLSRNLIAKLVGHLVENDVNTLHEEIKHLVSLISGEWCGHLTWREKSSSGALQEIWLYVRFWFSHEQAKTRHG